MTFFRPMDPSPDGAFTPVELLFEEPWGEVWRGKRADGLAVLIVAYTTAEGDALFEEASPVLEKWQRVAAGTVAQHLLKIHEINAGAIPYLLVDDPGGPTLRQYVEALEPGTQMQLEEQGRFGLAVANGMLSGETYDLTPMGITPDTVLQNPRDRTFPWQLLPVAPGTRGQFGVVCGGRYFPAEVRTAPNPARVHADSFALAWIWSDVFRRDFVAPHGSATDAIPYKGLRFVLEMCLEAKGGAFSDPNTISMGIDRWARKNLKEDQQAVAQADLERKRGPFVMFFVRNANTFKTMGIVTLVLGVLAGAGWGIVASGMLRPPLSSMEPADVVEMYLTAVIRGETSELQPQIAPPAARLQSDRMAEEIEQLEAANIIGKWNGYRTRMTGSGDSRVVEVFLVDNRRSEFGRLLLEVERRADMRWYIKSVYFATQTA